jgi:hypothetical protein
VHPTGSTAFIDSPLARFIKGPRIHVSKGKIGQRRARSRLESVAESADDEFDAG